MVAQLQVVQINCLLPQEKDAAMDLSIAN